MRKVAMMVVLLSAATPLFAAEGSYLYRAQLVQATPGKFVELLDLLGRESAVIASTGDTAPFIMRHSQGDHWDLMLLYPMGSYSEYYSAERVAKRRGAEFSGSNFAGRIQQDIAWQEDVFVYGPPLQAVKAAFAEAGFFHIEMIHALPGKQAELVKEREMESAYSKFLGRPELFIFVRDQGAAWDVFSIDFYRDIKHYAESADIPAEKQQAAAQAAGYTGPDQIGPYFRSVLAYHHDTLAVAVAPPAKK
ncbi:MAG TPA: hypothetical protein VN176_09805 [Verrucomicrobiae bacterium]|jgi:hypothetical protein|nr:hypothetical protein [Verrucomicrobiae bacterium]